MKLINSNQEEINVALQLNGQEVADLFALSGMLAGGLNGEESVRETMNNLYRTLADLTKQYEFPKARTLHNVYITNNLRLYDPNRQRVINREPEREVRVVPDGAGGVRMEEVAVQEAAVQPERRPRAGQIGRAAAQGVQAILAAAVPMPPPPEDDDF